MHVVTIISSHIFLGLLLLFFKNPFFCIPAQTKEKTKRVLLNDITGRASPGEMIAIMGSSGSGEQLGNAVFFWSMVNTIVPSMSAFLYGAYFVYSY